MMAILSEFAASGLFDEYELLVLEEAIHAGMQRGTRSAAVVQAIKKLRVFQDRRAGEEPEKP